MISQVTIVRGFHTLSNMIRPFDIINKTDVRWPIGFFEGMSHEEQSAISKNESFLVTDVHAGIVELEYIMKPLTKSWCYIHQNCIIT